MNKTVPFFLHPLSFYLVKHGIIYLVKLIGVDPCEKV